jgi:hypothetical protein
MAPVAVCISRTGFSSTHVDGWELCLIWLWWMLFSSPSITTTMAVKFFLKCVFCHDSSHRCLLSETIRRMTDR